MNKIYRKKAPSFLPATAVLEMTYRCNHQCLFCSCPWFADNGEFSIEKELTADMWKQVIKKLCSMGVNNLAFTGGEPLLKEGISDIITYAASLKTEFIETKAGSLVSEIKPPRLYLLTNGKILDNSILQMCKTLDIHLSISLPGLTSFGTHTNSNTCGYVLEGFSRARAMGIHSTCGVTVTRENISEIFQTLSAALLAGADSILLNRFLPGGRGIRYAPGLSLSKAQVGEMLDTAEEVLSLSGRKGSVGTELPKCIIPHRTYTHLKVGTRCSAAKDFFVIGPSGYVRVCNHSPIRLDHITRVEKVKHNPYWKTFVFKKYLPGPCASCNQVLSCDGGCREAAHITGGTTHSPDPLMKQALSFP